MAPAIFKPLRAKIEAPLIRKPADAATRPYDLQALTLLQYAPPPVFTLQVANASSPL